MKRLLSLLCIAALVITFFPSKAVATSVPTFQTSTNISTWLWDTSEIVTKPDSVIKSLVNNKVKVLFLQVNTSVNINYYQEFIREASANQISVHALDGSPDWVSDNGLQVQQVFISWLAKYQRAASTNEQFKGIHLDVEPYENKQYASNTNGVLERYQTLILRFTKQAVSSKLELGIDIPFWFYGVNYHTKYGTGNVAEWLCKNINNITIMAYRETAYKNLATGHDGIVEIAAAQMKLFDKYKVKGTIAVETGRLNDANGFVTFYEEGQAYMNQQLELVYESYKNNPAFNGVAIHHFDSWMNMAK